MGDDAYPLSIVLYLICVATSATHVSPIVREKLYDRMPDDAVATCSILVSLLGPIAIMASGLYWLLWLVYNNLGVALVHLVSTRRRAGLPRACTTRR